MVNSSPWRMGPTWLCRQLLDRKSTRLNSSHLGISYAVFCLKKKKDSINRVVGSTMKIEPRLAELPGEAVVSAGKEAADTKVKPLRTWLCIATGQCQSLHAH